MYLTRWNNVKRIKLSLWTKYVILNYAKSQAEFENTEFKCVFSL